MIERVHEHILTELQQNTRTDTIFIITAILINLITLAINSEVAEHSRTSVSNTIIMFIYFNKLASICQCDAVLPFWYLMVTFRNIILS